MPLKGYEYEIMYAVHKNRLLLFGSTPAVSTVNFEFAFNLCVTTI